MFTVKEGTSTGLRYVEKAQDEQMKNHQMDQTEICSAFMVEIPNSKYCPVSSFVFYLSKLDMKYPLLWQYPKRKGTYNLQDTWYIAKKIGYNSMATFMSKLSHAEDLSKVYTNHSICVTGATFLHCTNLSAKQIMSVIGHKSLNSLFIYQIISSNKKNENGCGHEFLSQ